MVFLRKLIGFLGFAFYLALGAIFIGLSIRQIEPGMLVQNINLLYESPAALIIVRILGFILILKGLLFLKTRLTPQENDKTITYENPDGEVVVSLPAVEEYINRTVKNTTRVKELRATLTSNKQGITVNARVGIFSDTPITEITEKVQTEIKNKITEMLGVDESLHIRVHVFKVLAKGEKDAPAEEEIVRPPFGE